MMASAPGTMIGRTLGHYRVVEQIGAGGMGVVYRAHDQRLERDVALKVLPPGTLIDESARKRFRKEALALSRLNHPNIATIFDFDTQNGADFLVTEFVGGMSLDVRVAAGALPEKDVVQLGMQMVEGLEAAHREGVIHRDLKPANLQVTPEGRVKILDFGLAKCVDPADQEGVTQSATEHGAVAGTLAYMAPEQLRGEKVDARSDLWSAGVVLYELATGRQPFEGATATSLSDEILHVQAPSPQLRQPRLSSRLTDVIQKCLEKDADNRYQSAKELAVDLRRLASASSIGSAAVPTRSARARRMNVVVTVVALVAVAAAAIFWLWRRAGKIAPTVPVTPSIAVLPFVDMSPQKDQEYFAEGLAEELLNRLATIPQLKVAGRTSSFQFKGKNEDLRAIGEKLNVGTILEGSVRKQGNRVRITAQLINVSDGFHLWSEHYDRELNDILSVQDDIALSVAGSMKMTLLGKVTAHPAQTTNVEAYDAYLQGQYFLQRPNQENLKKATSYYEQAIKLDPGYAPAWVGLGWAQAREADGGYVPTDEGYREARDKGERALALNPDLAEAHALVADLEIMNGWDWTKADASSKRALALDPENASALYNGAMLARTLGRFDEALALNRRAVEGDPLNARLRFDLSLTAYYAGRLDEAVAAAKKLLENPEQFRAHLALCRVYLAQGHPQEALGEIQQEKDLQWRLLGLALAYHALGRRQESDTALAELIAKFQTVSAFQIAEVYAFRGEANRAFEWLDRAYAQRDSGLTEIKGDPLLKNIQHDPRYIAFLKKLRLPLN